MKHKRWEMTQMQMLSLEHKIDETKIRIKDWYEYWKGDVFVSISGKDSTVLLHLVRSMYPDVMAVYVDTGLEYPEVRELALSQGNVTVLRPKKKFLQVLKEYGYPIISKEVSECVANAKKHLSGGGYDQHYRKLFGLGEYATKSKETNGNINKKGYP